MPSKLLVVQIDRVGLLWINDSVAIRLDNLVLIVARDIICVNILEELNCLNDTLSILNLLFVSTNHVGRDVLESEAFDSVFLE